MKGDVYRAMCEYIDKHDVRYFCDFVDYCFEHRPAWARIVASEKGTRFINEVIESRARRLYGLYTDGGLYADEA